MVAQLAKLHAAQFTKGSLNSKKRCLESPAFISSDTAVYRRSHALWIFPFDFTHNSESFYHRFLLRSEHPPYTIFNDDLILHVFEFKKAYEMYKRGKYIRGYDRLLYWSMFFSIETEEDCSRLEKEGGEVMAEAVKRLKNISHRRTRKADCFDESLHEFGLRVSEIVARTQMLHLQEEKNKLEQEIKKQKELLKDQKEQLKEQQELLNQALKEKIALYVNFRCNMPEKTVFDLLQNISSTQILEQIFAELKAQQAHLTTQNAIDIMHKYL